MKDVEYLVKYDLKSSLEPSNLDFASNLDFIDFMTIKQPLTFNQVLSVVKQFDLDCLDESLDAYTNDLFLNINLATHLKL